MAIDFKTLFEQFNNQTDKPIEFHNLLVQALQQLDSKLVIGEVVYDNGSAYLYDPTRDKFLACDRATAHISRYGANLKDTYLQVGGVSTAGDQGILMMRKGTITGLAIKSRSTDNFYVEIRKNNSPTTIYQLQVIGGQGVNATLDIDFDALDNIQIFMRGNGIDHPIASLEYTWRL